MASAEREPITGVWGQSPQRGVGLLSVNSPILFFGHDIRFCHWINANSNPNPNPIITLILTLTLTLTLTLNRPKNNSGELTDKYPAGLFRGQGGEPPEADIRPWTDSNLAFER